MFILDPDQGSRSWFLSLLWPWIQRTNRHRIPDQQHCSVGSMTVCIQVRSEKLNFEQLKQGRILRWQQEGRDSQCACIFLHTTFSIFCNEYKISGQFCILWCWKTIFKSLKSKYFLKPEAILWENTKLFFCILLYLGFYCLWALESLSFFSKTHVSEGPLVDVSVQKLVITNIEYLKLENKHQVFQILLCTMCN